uniref:Secreted protein n=1 Tax=Anopheles coluzzii TaxID=1518534 RepID=A0A8W7PUG2_ANOCL
MVVVNRQWNALLIVLNITLHQLSCVCVEGEDQAEDPEGIRSSGALYTILVQYDDLFCFCGEAADFFANILPIVGGSSSSSESLRTLTGPPSAGPLKSSSSSSSSWVVFELVADVYCFMMDFLGPPVLVMLVVTSVALLAVVEPAEVLVALFELPLP